MDEHTYQRAKRQAMASMNRGASVADMADNNEFGRLVLAINEVLSQLGEREIGPGDDAEMAFRQKLASRLLAPADSAPVRTIQQEVPQHEIPPGTSLVPCASEVGVGVWTLCWGLHITSENLTLRAPIYDSIPVWSGGRMTRETLAAAGYHLLPPLDEDDEDELE